jgi:hypothetical protein
MNSDAGKMHAPDPGVSPFTILILCSVLLLALTGCSTHPSSPAPPLVICDDGGGSSLQNKARFGIFSESFFGGFAPAIDSVAFLLGAVPGYVLWYQQIDDPFPSTVVAANDARGIATVVSLNVMSLALASAENDTLLDEVAHGAWDGALGLFADDARQAATTVYLRFGYEMNGNWFSWGGRPDAFKAAWLHARQVFAGKNASNVLWIFCPGAVWDGRTVAADIMPYYPGDSAVDIIGVDGYNFGDGHDAYHSWQSFDDIFHTTLLGLSGRGKPVWICETACPSDARRPAWLVEMLSFMDANPCVDALLWFNAHKSGEPDFRLESDTASLNVVKAWLSR